MKALLFLLLVSCETTTEIEDGWLVTANYWKTDSENFTCIYPTMEPLTLLVEEDGQILSRPDFDCNLDANPWLLRCDTIFCFAFYGSCLKFNEFIEAKEDLVIWDFDAGTWGDENRRIWCRHYFDGVKVERLFKSQ